MPGLFALTFSGEFKRLPALSGEQCVMDHDFTDLMRSVFARPDIDESYISPAISTNTERLFMMAISSESDEDEDGKYHDKKPAPQVDRFVQKWFTFSPEAMRDGAFFDQCSEFGGILFLCCTHPNFDDWLSHLNDVNFSDEQLDAWEQRFKDCCNEIIPSRKRPAEEECPQEGTASPKKRARLSIE